MLDCGSPQVSGDSAREGETASATVSFDPAEADSTVLTLSIRRPNDDPGQEGDLGPEHVTVELSVRNAILFEGDYEPEYVVQSRGRGCGSCVHEGYEHAVLPGE